MATRETVQRSAALSEQHARQRIRELHKETALLAGQPTFETRRGTRRRHEKLRRRLRELRDLEQRVGTGS